jgi:putative sterol carrier protein
MAAEFASDQWAAEFGEQINKSSVYKSAAKGWKWTVGLVIEAEPDKGFPQARALLMDLYEGEARSVKMGTVADAQQCAFIITAPYSRWKEVVKKQLDATKGMLQGKLKLKGDLPTIVRYTKATQEVAECSTRVPVEWPDER